MQLVHKIFQFITIPTIPQLALFPESSTLFFSQFDEVFSTLSMLKVIHGFVSYQFSIFCELIKLKLQVGRPDSEILRKPLHLKNSQAKLKTEGTGKDNEKKNQLISNFLHLINLILIHLRKGSASYLYGTLLSFSWVVLYVREAFFEKKDVCNLT